MTRSARVGPEELGRELSRLRQEIRDSLVQRWTDLYGTAPPPRISRSLLMRAVAYKLQEQLYGGLPASVRRALLGSPTPRASRKRPRRVGTGTVLLREWRGKTHQVTIETEGVLYQGHLYRSLSEVARTITGCRWSGPAFFGLKKHDQG